MNTQEKSIWKYCYWLDTSLLSQLKSEMEQKGTPLHRAQRNPCEALKGDIGYAEPPVWKIICAHDALPWYRASKHQGKCLVVSSFALGEPYTLFLETTITKTSFQPDEFPSKEQIAELAKDKAYRSLHLEGWGAFPQEMGKAIVKGLSKMSGKPLATFEELLSLWDGVHSNFLNPKFRTKSELMCAPFSVTDSIHIGTCCVELFNLLASKENALLVRPCIGSVIVGVLEKDRYYLVRLEKTQVSK